MGTPALDELGIGLGTQFKSKLVPKMPDRVLEYPEGAQLNEHGPLPKIYCTLLIKSVVLPIRPIVPSLAHSHACILMHAHSPDHIHFISYLCYCITLFFHSPEKDT